MQIKIRRNKTDKDPMIFEYDFGGDVDNAVNTFDGESPLEKVVYGLFVVAAKQQLAEFVRTCLVPRTKGKGKNKKKEPMTVEEIQEALLTWKPTVERRASANVTRAAKNLSKLSAEEKAALKKMLAESEEAEVV